LIGRRILFFARWFEAVAKSQFVASTWVDAYDIMLDATTLSSFDVDRDVDADRWELRIILPFNADIFLRDGKDIWE
jgi:hypothetical protein